MVDFCWRTQPISYKPPSNLKTRKEDLESGKRAEKSGPGRGSDSRSGMSKTNSWFGTSYRGNIQPIRQNY